MSVPIPVARRLVFRHHYAGGAANTATFLHGLFRKDDRWNCLGVAWWIPPTRSAAEATWEGHPDEVLSLSRLVVVPEVPTNGASFLIGQSIRRIKRDGRFRCLVTYADTWQNHTGAIYRATNWEYLGSTAAEALWVDPATGRMVARKAGPKTRTAAEMEALGYEMAGRFPKEKFRMVIGKPRIQEAAGPEALDLFGHQEGGQK